MAKENVKGKKIKMSKMYMFKKTNSEVKSFSREEFISMFKDKKVGENKWDNLKDNLKYNYKEAKFNYSKEKDSYYVYGNGLDKDLVKEIVDKIEDINVININKDMFTLRRYNGSSDNRQIKYNNTLYMVKYSKTKKNIIDKGDLTIHRQTAITEYIASKILKLYGLNTQEVEIGWDKEKNEYCVLCKDFNIDNNLIMLNAESSKDIQQQKELRKTLNDLNVYLIPKLLDRYVKNGLNKNEFIDYWITLSVLDYLIGNRDRHLGNIGLLIKDDKLIISPTFDNGACLGCHLHIEDDFSMSSEMTSIMKNQYLYENYNGINVNYSSIKEKKLPKKFYEKVKEIIGNDKEPKGLEIFNKIYNLPKLTEQQKAHIILAKRIYLYNFALLKENIK